jgi:hypothetical protein
MMYTEQSRHSAYTCHFRQSVGADIIFTKGLYHMAWGILMTGFTLVGMVFLLVSNVAASNRPA